MYGVEVADTASGRDQKVIVTSLVEVVRRSHSTPTRRPVEEPPPLRNPPPSTHHYCLRYESTRFLGYGVDTGDCRGVEVSSTDVEKGPPPVASSETFVRSGPCPLRTATLLPTQSDLLSAPTSDEQTSPETNNKT
ncbi:hypothetical protein AAG570_007117 [Ranatra chinensis]|uniref:Uncharacterized protein n=1 Tax=Ranatra chinensis TaxID=642074 RepID=A0ABD0XV05_9HEMI